MQPFMCDAPRGAIYRTHVVLHVKDPSRKDGIARFTKWDLLIAGSIEEAADLVRNKYVNDNPEGFDLHSLRIFSINHLGDLTL